MAQTRLGLLNEKKGAFDKKRVKVVWDNEGFFDKARNQVKIRQGRNR